MCRAEAQGLSTLLPEMEARGVRLHAVVHQRFGASEFKPFLQGGEVYLDLERKFYGPQERWMNIPGIFNFESLAIAIKDSLNGTPGNLEGEGRLLGGLFVIGPGEQGIIFQHHEYPIGNRADIERVREAIQKVNHPTQ
ncbi:peroxiredoxin-like 2A [Dreissena polymorpha]|uniref:Peroxiredoxin-like 2A n=1 Tax=Dreissena polymorpha TaxID=45954 RepID=A0A9D4RCD8_DREPO|nr:peroxiredoxin-like 2A [Dreissena polymorpha]KAH3863084.1 hypothetical protein DPMN_026062 [Dreissena polymorpha]